MEGDFILSVQRGELREVAELRWNGAIEPIRVEVPKRPTITHREQLTMRNIQITDYNKRIMSNQR